MDSVRQTRRGPERRRFVLEAGGHRLCALWVAPAGADPAAPPLVFLHEGLGSIAQWTARGVDVPAALAAATGRCALVYDRLGFGGSDPLPGPRGRTYHFAEAWTALPAVLDACGLDEVLPVGHSDGATIALLFAARFPGRCAGLVLEAPHVMLEARTLAGIAAAHRSFHVRNSRLRASLVRHHGAKTDATFAGWADLWLDPAFADFDIRGHLRDVACPVLALQGARDEFATAAQLTAIAEGVGGPCETWVVPHCRHVPHFQATGPVLTRIADFVARSAIPFARAAE
jgi:pimeloyl-ACP methyl ester carboxylesterase